MLSLYFVIQGYNPAEEGPESLTVSKELFNSAYTLKYWACILLYFVVQGNDHAGEGQESLKVSTESFKSA